MKTNILADLKRPTPANSFRLLLQAELGRRCAGNPQYSLRAFAKFLGLDHATLSQLMRGKRRLTRTTILKLGGRLGLTKPKIEHYCARAASETPLVDEPVNMREIQQMAHDTAAVIGDWYHYAILELTRLESFQANSRWIARVLGLTPDEVNIAVARLARLGMLEMASRTCWIDKSGDTTASLSDFTQVSVQRLAAAARGLMLNALEAGARTKCLHSATTLAMPSQRLPEVRERIARFLNDLKSMLQHDKQLDDVFQLELSLFPLTNFQQLEEINRGTTGNAMANRGAESR